MNRAAVAYLAERLLRVCWLLANGPMGLLNLFPVLAKPIDAVHLSLVFRAIRMSWLAAKSLGRSNLC